MLFFSIYLFSILGTCSLLSFIFSSQFFYSFLRTFQGMGRFKSLVDSEEGIENIRAQYRIHPGVGLRYCKEA